MLIYQWNCFIQLKLSHHLFGVNEALEVSSHLIRFILFIQLEYYLTRERTNNQRYLQLKSSCSFVSVALEHRVIIIHSFFIFAESTHIRMSYQGHIFTIKLVDCYSIRLSWDILFLIYIHILSTFVFRSMKLPIIRQLIESERFISK